MRPEESVWAEPEQGLEVWVHAGMVAPGVGGPHHVTCEHGQRGPRHLGVACDLAAWPAPPVPSAASPSPLSLAQPA